MSISKFYSSVVYPIPPSFYKEQLDTDAVYSYLKYLYKNGAKVFMTTAGTSKFDLLSEDEIHQLNDVCYYFCRNKDDISFICAVSNKSINLSSSKVLPSYNCYNKSDALLLLYPDRYYNDEHIVEYFKMLADVSSIPVMFHGLAMRHGRGGTYQYMPKLVRKLKNCHYRIIGMKEESLDWNVAYNISRQADDDFIVIVAGMSARRFLFCGPGGAQTYLAGVGSFFPKIEEFIFDELNLVYTIWVGEYLRKFEDPLFKLAERYGWHIFMETGLDVLNILNTEGRKPFPILSDNDREYIRNKLLTIKGQSSWIKESG